MPVVAGFGRRMRPEFPGAKRDALWVAVAVERGPSPFQVLKRGKFVKPGDTLVFITQVRPHNEIHDFIQPRIVT